MNLSTQVVRLDDVDDTVGPLPSQRMAESVERIGVIVPPMLAERVGEGGELDYRIIDGNRRVAAARRAGLEEIPAVVVQGASDGEVAEMTLAANALRSSNYVTELWALNDLRELGVPARQLEVLSGMSSGMIGTRELLVNLDRTLFQAFVEGKIAPSVALAAARVDPEDQETLARVYRDKDRLTRPMMEAAIGPVRKEAVTTESVTERLRDVADDARSLVWSEHEWLTAARAVWNAQADNEG